jgi:hypothetical protein
MDRIIMDLSRIVMGVVAAMPLLASAPDAYCAEPFWIYDGTTSAWVMWSDGTTANANEPYFGYTPPLSALAATGLSTANAKSSATGLSADSLSVGTAGSHSAGSDSRANNTLFVDPGRYTVSFDYEVGPQATENPLARSWAAVGMEFESTEYRISESGAGHYSATVQLPGWVAFYALTGTAAADGTAETFASLANISVIPVPEAKTYLLLLAGLRLVAATRRRKA